MDCKRCEYLEAVVDAYVGLIEGYRRLLDKKAPKPPSPEKPKCSNCGKAYKFDEDRMIYRPCSCHKDPNEVILEGLDKLYGKPDDWKEFAKELLGFLAEEATGDRFDGQKFRVEWTTALRKDL